MRPLLTLLLFCGFHAWAAPESDRPRVSPTHLGALVQFRSGDPEGPCGSSGAGFFVDAGNRLIFTAEHVLHDAEKKSENVWIFYKDATGQRQQLRLTDSMIQWVSSQVDLAILKLPKTAPSPGQALRLAEVPPASYVGSSVPPLQELYVSGFPGDLCDRPYDLQTVETYVYSRRDSYPAPNNGEPLLHRTGARTAYALSNTLIAGGYSGGPLVIPGTDIAVGWAVKLTGEQRIAVGFAIRDLHPEDFAGEKDPLLTYGLKTLMPSTWEPSQERLPVPEKVMPSLGASSDKQVVSSTTVQDKPIPGPAPLARRREDSDPHAREGHYGVTNLALRTITSTEPTDDPAIQARRTLAFPYAVRELIRDASRQPDFYESNNPAAHAQTPSIEARDGKAFDTCAPSDADPAYASACALKAFIEWERRSAFKMRRACDLGQGDLVFYRVGYALHALQDFATRKGRTDAEYSWDVLYGFNPDEKPRNLALALDISERYLVAVGELLLKYCPHAADTVTLFQKGLSEAEKAQAHPKGRDLSIGSSLRYRALGEKYKKLVAAREERPIRWFATPGEAYDWHGPEPEVCSQDPRCEEIFQQILTATSAELTPGP